MPDLESRFRGADRIPTPRLWEHIGSLQPRSSPEWPSLARRGVIAGFALGIAVLATAFAVRALDDGDGGRSVTQPLPQPIVPHTNGQILFRIGSGDGPSWTDTIQPDGTGRHTFFPAEAYSSTRGMAWSPDGAKIAYVHLVEGGSRSADGYAHYAIVVANADGSDPRQVSPGVNDRWPPWLTWSPDGTQIAFSSLDAGDPSDSCIPGGDFMCPTDIYVMNVDGSGIRRITTDPAAEFQPAWSPDGTQIAFVRQMDATGSRTGVFVMNVDGTDRAELAPTTEGSNFSPSWSPDASQLVFSSTRAESWQIYVVNADGTGAHPLRTDRRYAGGAVWSPDGTMMAFVGAGGLTGGGGDTALYVMRSDGTGITKLADEPGYGVAGDIAWQPLLVPRTAEAPSTSPATGPGAAAAFVPGTRRVGGKVELNVTFPDGSTAQLAYPPSLDLAGLGVAPYWTGCGADFGFFHYDPYGSLYEGEPIQTWIGSDGQTVGLWPGVKGMGPSDHLIWHFGPWTVEKYEYRVGGSTSEELAACAEGLRATVTDAGWIVIDGPQDVRLSRGFGPPGGAELEFGDLAPRRFVLMWPGPCDEVGGGTVIDGVSVDLSKDFASWCDPGGQMRIHVYFEPGSTFFRDVFDGLAVQEVTLATRGG